MSRKMQYGTPKEIHDYYQILRHYLTTAEDICYHIARQPDCTDEEAKILRKASSVLSDIYDRITED